MERRTRWALGVALLAVAVGLTVPAVVGAGPDSSATVRFGNPTVGSPFPPPAFDHDSSPNATDNLIPRTSVISAGGNVTFEVAGFHQVMGLLTLPGVRHVAVVEIDCRTLPGTTPDDIVVPPFPPNLFINFDGGLLLAAGPPAGVEGSWTPPTGTFAAPGRYLVLCNVTPHFAIDNMYGWVTVK